MIVINVVNIYPIINGKHNPTMSGKHRPAIDNLLIYQIEEAAGSSPARSTCVPPQVGGIFLPHPHMRVWVGVWSFPSYFVLTRAALSNSV